MDAAKKKALAAKYKKMSDAAKKPKTDKNKGTQSSAVDSVGELYKKYGLK